jgi:hypothetical protein
MCPVAATVSDSAEVFVTPKVIFILLIVLFICVYPKHQRWTFIGKLHSKISKKQLEDKLVAKSKLLHAATHA